MSRFADPELIELAQARNVSVSLEAISKERRHRERKGTGFILQTGFVVSCEHVDNLDTVMMVDGRAGRIIYKHKDYDLILIKVETPEIPKLEFSKDYQVGEPVFWCGNPEGEKKARGFCCPGYIGKVTKKRIYASTLGVAGASGGLLWSITDGKPVGINYERLGPIGKFLNSQQIEQFVTLGLRQYESQLGRRPVRRRRRRFVDTRTLPLPFNV